MLKIAALVFAAVFLLIGILGFVPAAIPDGNLLGIFKVDTLHNIIHLLSGAVALYVGLTSEAHSKLYFQVFGSVYALVTLVGFLQYNSPTELGLFAINPADHYLHLVLAVAMLAIGFGLRPKTTVSA